MSPAQIIYDHKTARDFHASAQQILLLKVCAVSCFLLLSLKALWKIHWQPYDAGGRSASHSGAIKAMKMKSTDVLNPRLANHTLKLRVAQN